MEIQQITNLYQTDLELIVGQSEWYVTFDKKYELYDFIDSADFLRPLPSNQVSFYHYPSGEVYTPFEKQAGVIIDERISFYDDCIYFSVGDFNQGLVMIYQYQMRSKELSEITSFSTAEISLYNLQVGFEPLMIFSENTALDIYYPERLTIELKPNESFVCKKDEKYYFTAWVEEKISDDDYYCYELYRIKNKKGELVEEGRGMITQLPNGNYIIG